MLKDPLVCQRSFRRRLREPAGRFGGGLFIDHPHAYFCGHENLTAHAFRTVAQLFNNPLTPDFGGGYHRSVATQASRLRRMCSPSSRKTCPTRSGGWIVVARMGARGKGRQSFVPASALEKPEVFPSKFNVG